MGALGGFAEGLAKGISQGEELKLRKKQAENEDRRMQMAEDEHSIRMKQNKRDDDYLEAVKGEQGKFLAELNGNPISTEDTTAADKAATSVNPEDSPVPMGASAPSDQMAAPAPAVGGGNLAPAAPPAPIPVQANQTPEMLAAAAKASGSGQPSPLQSLPAPGATPAPAPAAPAGNLAAPAPAAARPKTMDDVLNDPELSLKFAARMGSVAMAHGKMPPEEMLKLSQTIKELRQQRGGEQAIRVISGDLSAVADYEKAKGWQPGTVKVTNDPKTLEVHIKTPDGDYNATAFAYMLGGHNAMQTAAAMKSEKRGDVQFDQSQQMFPLQVQAAKGNIAETAAKTEKLIPSEVRRNDATARMDDARGSYFQNGGAGGGKGTSDPRITDAALKYVTKDESNNPDKLMLGGMVRIMSSKYSGETVDNAAAKAQRDYIAQSAAVDQMIGKMKTDKTYDDFVKKAKSNGVTDIRSALIQSRIESAFPDVVSTPPTKSGNKNGNMRTVPPYNPADPTDPRNPNN